MHAMALDEFDLGLLAALQDNGRLTNAELGERIGLSPSQCSRRRAALEAAGVIAGYRAELSAEALGFGLLAFISVSLSAHSGDNAERFRELVRGVAAIQEAHALTGDADYLLKAALPNLASLSRLVNGVLLSHPSVARVRSSVVLERIKDARRLPLDSR